MANGQRTCYNCAHYKQMGEKGFCFKQNRVVTSRPDACDNFEINIDEEMKKRWFLDKKEKRIGTPKEDFKDITVEQMPEGSDEFRLPKKGTSKDRLFIDTPITDEPAIQKTEEALDKGDNLFLGIIVGGIAVLIIILFALGVL